MDSSNSVATTKIAGGKRKVNKSLKAWVAFVKKVQKEEKLSYKDAIHRAKVRKDKGEKWMMGGTTSTGSLSTVPLTTEVEEDMMDETPLLGDVGEQMSKNDNMSFGGRRRRRTMRRSRGRGRTSRRRRASRRR